MVPRACQSVPRAALRTRPAEQAAKNRARHGVSFGEAVTTFADPRARIFDDPDHSVTEDRFLLVGRSARLRTLVVSFSYREPEDRIRVISARRATSREEEQYLERRM